VKRAILVMTFVLVAGAAFAGWWFLVRDDTPPEAALPDREAGSGVETDGEAPASPEGGWMVAPGEETFVGFRITEHFPAVDNTAVIRTPAVEGALVVVGPAVTEAFVEADLTGMESTDSVPPGIPGIENRVEQMRSDGLETDSFPTATFELVEPIDLGGVPARDQVVTAEAAGELTVHGVTRRVAVPVEARWSGELVDVAGSLGVALDDFGIEPPERPFVRVDDRGTFEFQLTFEKVA
jgi:polyisoprenoid-binding protein YceI